MLSCRAPSTAEVECAAAAGSAAGIENGLATTGVAGPALERGVFGIDQPAVVALHSAGERRAAERNIDKQRVGVIRVAIGTAPASSFRRSYEPRQGELCPIAFRSMAFEDLQRFEQVGALRPWSRTCRWSDPR